MSTHPEPGPDVIAVYDEGAGGTLIYLVRDENNPELWSWRQAIAEPLAHFQALPWAEQVGALVGPIAEVVG